MPKKMTSQELIAYSKKCREILRNHRCVACTDKKADSTLYAPSDTIDESDICVDKYGTSIIKDLRQAFYEFEDPYYKERRRCCT